MSRGGDIDHDLAYEQVSSSDMEVCLGVKTAHGNYLWELNHLCLSLGLFFQIRLEIEHMIQGWAHEA